MNTSYTLINVAKDLFTGKLKLASSEIVASRKAICEPCEARNGAICTACGCVLQLKTRLKDSTCPMELW
jgi:Family of unknown function (DUF6171)